MTDTLTPEPQAEQRTRPKTAHVTQSTAGWLVLAYLAADNDLEGELLADLAEMERVGSTPGVVEILAQVDRARGQNTSKGNWYGTRRYYVTRGSDRRKISSRLLADLGPTNTGDPGVLESFIRFGAQRYPARATALVLLNHGSGFYVPPEMLSRGAEGPGHDRPSPTARRRRRPAIFHTTREHLLETAPQSRGIAYDDGAADCLDNQELTRVLATAHRVLGRKVDVVGMDACLMTMIEVAYQLRDHAQVLVGSEETEPGPGWPHAAILGDLTARPAMTAGELGGTVVTRYVASYRHSGQLATQSAIDLGQLGDLVEAVDILAHRLLDDLKRDGLVEAIRHARARTLQFFDGLYLDLHHLAGNLAKAAGPGPIADACIQIRRVIAGEGAPSPIIAEAYVGARMAPARGLSIYFPTHGDPTVHYRDLAFAKRTRWADFLEAFSAEGRG